MTEPVAKSARLFFALWPSPPMQAALAAAAERAVLDVQSTGAAAGASAGLRAGAGARADAPPAAAGPAASSGVRQVPTANLHLTLAFLGSVPLSRLAVVDQAASAFVQAASVRELPIQIVLDALEHWRKPQVLVATASDTPPAAIELADGLKRSLVDAGFSPDLKPFRVHATVARKVRRVAHELHIEPVRWSFDSLHLVQSESHPDGSAYRPIKKWVLDKRD